MPSGGPLGHLHLGLKFAAQPHSRPGDSAGRRLHLLSGRQLRMSSGWSWWYIHDENDLATSTTGMTLPHKLTAVLEGCTAPNEGCSCPVNGPGAPPPRQSLPSLADPRSRQQSMTRHPPHGRSLAAENVLRLPCQFFRAQPYCFGGLEQRGHITAAFWKAPAAPPPRQSPLRPAGPCSC